MPRPVRLTANRHPLKAVATGILAALAVVAAAAGFLYVSRDSEESPTVGPARAPASSATVSRAAGVEAGQSSVDLGRVPVDTNVDQVFRLRNAGSGQATLGRPRIETLEGC